MKQIFKKIGKHILALPTYPFFALCYMLKKLDSIIDYCLSIYLSIIKKIIK